MISGSMIEAVLFDFGGVLADEGFRIGLHAIAGANGLDPERFFLLARELVYSTGYLTGRVDEHAYWNALRSDAGISGNDADLREIILEGFSLRTWMLDIVRQLKDGGIRLFILSDQTNWLDELEERNHFFYLFEKVFNSFHTGKSKRDPRLFHDVLSTINLSGEHVLFIDDTCEHIVMAQGIGLQTIWYQGKNDFSEKTNRLFPALLDQK